MTVATTTASAPRAAASLGDWVDRHVGRIMVLPAVLIVLAFSLFPMIVSIYLAVSRFALAPGGYKITYVGLFNFARLFTGAQQYHFLGTFGAFGFLSWLAVAAAVSGVLWWLYGYVTSGELSVIGLVGRLVTASVGVGLVVLFAATILAGGFPGTLMTTIVYVAAGVATQFAIGLGLALLCAQPIRGRNFFRVVFFIPLMVTPVGIGYTFRMLADMDKGPLAPLSPLLHLGTFAWATDPWSARVVVLIGDTWQWTPFMFIVLLAAVEARPHEQIEAAKIDGAHPLQIFSYVTWPAIAPVAATVVLIRLIEAFKIIDLPNILTGGGPGLATESMTLHSFIAWRTQDLGGSAAVGYVLLFIATVTCVSFFNFGVQRARRYQS